MSSSSRTRSLFAAVPARVEEAIGIARPPETVWAVVADPRNDPRWCRTVKSVDVIGERHWRVMHKPIPLRPPRELELKQLEAERPRRLVLRQEDAAAVFDVEYRLEPTQTGTRFTQVSQFAWKRLPLVLHGTFGRAVRREVRGQLRTLRTLLERDGPRDG
jgi:uncharacterized protein YndB with AHSA1/START domain